MVLATHYKDFDFADNTYFCAIGTQDKTLIEVLDKAFEEKNIPEFIVISDISLSEDTCNYLERLSSEFNITLLGIDHHKTNNLNEKFEWFRVYKDKNLDDARFEDGVYISAAWALLNYISTMEKTTPDSSLSILIDMISRYDTWEWVYHPHVYSGPYSLFKEDVTAVICKYMGAEKTFEELYKMYINNTDSTDNKVYKKLFPDMFLTIYNIEKTKEEFYLSKVESKVRIVDLYRYTTAIIINENEYSNAAASQILQNNSFIDIVMVIYPAGNTIGFRTKSNKIDVGEFAKNYFGGGGHPKASGAKNLDSSTMSTLLELYYIVGDSIEEYNNNLMKGEDVDV